MAQLLVVYDPSDRIHAPDFEEKQRFGLKDAVLSIPEDLEGKDIYGLAKKLAELLLEQL